MTTGKLIHKTVLLNEVIEGLNLSTDSVVLDGTFGGGGHSLEILLKYPNAKVIAMDQDNSVWSKAKEKFHGLENRIFFKNKNFRNLDEALSGEKVSSIIFDLGLSSDQLENSGRGFSFLRDEPLLMTMKNQKDYLPLSEDVTAIDVVNTWSEESLADIIYGYGEERYARKIARGIVEKRSMAKIATTFDLVEIVKANVPASYRRGRIHPATKTFQAIRIAVNDELGALSEGLTKGFEALKSGGRMAAVTFHSLEDRIVKRFYKAKEKENLAKLINKKIILASSEEIKNNPRSRSAKLRILSRR